MEENVKILEDQNWRVTKQPPPIWEAEYTTKGGEIIKARINWSFYEYVMEVRRGAIPQEDK